MKFSRLFLWAWVGCLLLLGVAFKLHAQPAEPGSQAGSTPAKKVEAEAGETIKGQATPNAHAYKMEKGITYRIIVKANSFLPQVRIDGKGGGALPAASFPLLTKGLGGPPPSNDSGRSAQILFTAPATREYQIRVNQLAGGEVGAGPLLYALTVERASFQSQLADNDARLEITEDTKKLEQGKVYGITVTGKGFAPEVQVVDGNRSLATAFNGRWFGFGPDAQFVTTMTFLPARTADYRILVGVGPLTEKRNPPLAYNTEVVELKIELSLKDRLGLKDPAYPRRGGLHKVHMVKLEAGKTYQMDMISSLFDPYLFLEDSAGNLLMEDDDSGEARNARIIFRAAKSDTFRIVATTFHRAADGAVTGEYTLTVVENANAQPRFGSPWSGGKMPDLSK